MDTLSNESLCLMGQNLSFAVLFNNYGTFFPSFCGASDSLSISGPFLSPAFQISSAFRQSGMAPKFLEKLMKEFSVGLLQSKQSWHLLSPAPYLLSPLFFISSQEELRGQRNY